jgi:hypothetical protein
MKAAGAVEESTGWLAADFGLRDVVPYGAAQRFALGDNYMTGRGGRLDGRFMSNHNWRNNI